MNCRTVAHIAVLGCLIVPGSAWSASKTAPARPEIFNQLVACRSLTDNAARLACFDKQTAALDEAERTNQLVVVDRAEVKKAKRGLFGLSLPNLGGLFSRGDGKEDAADEVDEIETTIRGLGSTGEGKLLITLDDGARWQQIDGSSIRTPKVGQSIKIRRATMGSYFANINGQPAIRMKRIN